MIMSATAACFSAEARQTAEPKIIRPDKASSDALQFELTDYKFETVAASASAGSIDFVVHNGGEQDHEFVITPMERGRFGLPIGEIEAFGPGETRAIRAELVPGDYEFVCLIVSVVDDEPQSHMALGMRVAFEVTE